MRDTPIPKADPFVLETISEEDATYLAARIRKDAQVFCGRIRIPWLTGGACNTILEALDEMAKRK